MLRDFLSMNRGHFISLKWGQSEAALTVLLVSRCIGTDTPVINCIFWVNSGFKV